MKENASKINIWKNYFRNPVLKREYRKKRWSIGIRCYNAERARSIYETNNYVG